MLVLRPELYYSGQDTCFGCTNPGSIPHIIHGLLNLPVVGPESTESGINAGHCGILPLNQNQTNCIFWFSWILLQWTYACKWHFPNRVLGPGGKYKEIELEVQFLYYVFVLFWQVSILFSPKSEPVDVSISSGWGFLFPRPWQHWLFLFVDSLI